MKINVLRPQAAEPECDFCSNPNPRHGFHNRAFGVRTAKGLIDVEAGIWAACDTCAPLIEAGEWETLIDRVLEKYAVKETDKPGMREYFRTIYSGLKASLQPEGE